MKTSPKKWIIFSSIEILIFTYAFFVSPVLNYIGMPEDGNSMNAGVDIDYYSSFINAVLYSLAWFFIFIISGFALRFKK